MFHFQNAFRPGIPSAKALNILNSLARGKFPALPPKIYICKTLINTLFHQKPYIQIHQYLILLSLSAHALNDSCAMGCISGIRISGILRSSSGRAISS